MGIKLTNKVKNYEVLGRLRGKLNLWKDITKRRNRLVEHILRHIGSVHTVIEGTVPGKISIEKVYC